ncbi:MAG: hypothetical protein D6718_12390, partial [Acidobacteria bacterium]
MNRKRGTGMPRLGIAAASVLAAVLAAAAATPPGVLNYQGVLRDAADKPLDGSYDMVFRFWSAETGGDEILIDRHLSANGQAVTVSGGLFSVQLGTGEVLDGSGPGTYTSLTPVFADYGDVWLEVEVGGETLSPRIRVTSSGYALNASRLEGRPASGYLDTSGVEQTKAGRLVVDATGRTGFGLTAYGDSAAVYFKNADASGRGYLANGDIGVHGYGNFSGGYFADSDNSGEAYVGYWDYGISAHGGYAGAYCADSDNSGYAYVGYGDDGIAAYGNLTGGFFQDRDSSGYAYVGNGDYGIRGFGSFAGGYFKDSDGTGDAYVGYGDTGISAQGSVAGGYFADSDGTGSAHVGYGSYGIDASGTSAGGYFSDSNGSGYAYVGYSDDGISASGSYTGGYFRDSDNSGYAYVAYGDDGIRAYGGSAGGFFQNTADSNSYVRLAQNDKAAELHSSGVLVTIGSQGNGIEAYATGTAGHFEDTGTGTYARVGDYTYSLYGNGSKHFVQNHPYDPSLKVLYACLEGDEVATYTRGRGRLQNGRAVISLDETFALVTNPDIGLTAHVTPRGSAEPLAVESVTTEQLVVVGEPGSDAAFDYVVYGLRIGFEEVPAVQPKKEGEDAPIPSMAEHRHLLAERPELRAYTPLDRFRTMAAEVDGVAPEAIDLSRSQALVAAIHELDPAVDGLGEPPAPPAADVATAPEAA